ncbi:MAG TPA: c-type cytochrome [Gemmatimonadales bacterium]|jgi:mono/diheme cytochrome c family protein|nr:c-type cytochrome [Gemmatimonadales bacterium]
MHRLTLSILIAGSAALGACSGRRDGGGSAGDSTARTGPPDSGRATEIERAPRADPTAPPGKPPLTPTDPYHPVALDTVDATLYTGWKYYNHDCARCHGQDATGSTIAPYLIESFRTGRVDSAEFWRVMRGSRAANGMPSFVGSMDEDKLGAIYAYLKGRGQGKLHPGRPATR